MGRVNSNRSGIRKVEIRAKEAANSNYIYDITRFSLSIALADDPIAQVLRENESFSRPNT